MEELIIKAIKTLDDKLIHVLYFHSNLRKNQILKLFKEANKYGYKLEYAFSKDGMYISYKLIIQDKPYEIKFSLT
ncbi:MAG: hypothetical protein F6K39_35865 [Okeania sp. SIO3B3]|nr:hypothetical protein [Okeania sp. SIO3B3]